MISKILIISLILGIVLNGVSSAALSKVYFQSGSEALPVEYIQYGVPSVSLGGPQIGQISAGAVGQVIPVPSATGLVAPCAMPCVYPGQMVASVASKSPAEPNKVTYKSSVPVIMPAKEEAPGYQYSYVVYDENTGDHKSQHELSDGSIVQGEYSLLQPDGFVREVTYVADNERGFNAIVKHFLPENKQKNNETKQKPNQEPPPCPKVQKDTPEILKIKPEKPADEASQKLTVPPLNDEIIESKQTNDQIMFSAKTNFIPQNSGSNSKGITQKKITPIESIGTELNNQKAIVVSKAISETIPIDQSKDLKSETQSQSKSGEANESATLLTEINNNSVGERNNGARKDNTEYAVRKEEKNSQNAPEVTDILISYNDVIKCIHAAANGVLKSGSPLTYLVLNKPCSAIST